MPLVTTSAQPPLDFFPPRFNPWVLATTRTLLPAWLAWKTNLTDIQVANIDALVHLYQQFQNGDTRFLIAFRHPSPDDPCIMAHVLWRAVPQAA